MMKSSTKRWSWPDVSRKGSVPMSQTSLLEKHSYSDFIKEDARRAQSSFSYFVKAAWRVVEPVPYVHGYHIDAICEHLVEVSKGNIKRLLINMPPRHGKSTIVRVLWQGWTLLSSP